MYRQRVAAQTAAPVKIVVVTDMAGVFAPVAGPGSVLATKMAVADFGGKVLGRPIEVDVIDHRNDAPRAAAALRAAFENGADLAVDFTNAKVAVAAAVVAQQEKKLIMVTGSATSALSGAACNRYTYRYGYDLYALAHSTGANVASQSDGKTWNMLVANYAFGRELAADFTDAIEAKGGTVLPSDPVVVAATDYSAALEAAKNSKAQVLGFMNYGPDTLNSVKQARQLGLDKQMQFAVGLLFLSDVAAAPGVYSGARAATSWYWDMDDQAACWAREVRPRGARRRADRRSGEQLFGHDAVARCRRGGRHDRRRQGAGDLDGRQISDFEPRGGEIRARDHQLTHDMYVVESSRPGPAEEAAGVVQDRPDDPAQPRVPAGSTVGVPAGPLGDAPKAAALWRPCGGPCPTRCRSFCA